IAAAALRAGPQRARVASAVRNETPEKPGTGGRPGSSVAASARRMARVLVLFAHPALEKSRVGRRLLDAIQSVPSVQIHDLYEEYPEFDIDVEREQELLRSHDVIVLMHPLYWYSTPALLKQWFDLVLEHGFAYGEGGRALQGKRLLCAISTGGTHAAYQPGGYHDITIGELLAP